MSMIEQAGSRRPLSAMEEINATRTVYTCYHKEEQEEGPTVTSPDLQTIKKLCKQDSNYTYSIYPPGTYTED